MNIEVLYSLFKNIVAEFKTSRHLQIERRESHYRVTYHWIAEENLPGAVGLLVMLGSVTIVPLLFVDELIVDLIQTAESVQDLILSLIFVVVFVGGVFYVGYKFLMWFVFGKTELKLYEDRLEIDWWFHTGIRKIDFMTIPKADIRGVNVAGIFGKQLRIQLKDREEENLMDSRSVADRNFLQRILEIYIQNKTLAPLDGFLASPEAVDFRATQIVRQDWLVSLQATPKEEIPVRSTRASEAVPRTNEPDPIAGTPRVPHLVRALSICSVLGVVEFFYYVSVHHKDWLQKPGLLIAIGVAGTLLYAPFILFNTSVQSGWQFLAQRYRATRPTSGRPRFASMYIVQGLSRRPGGPIWVLARIDSGGIGLSVLPVFRLFHPQLFISWSDISGCKTEKLGLLVGTVLHLRNATPRLLFTDPFAKALLDHWRGRHSQDAPVLDGQTP